MKRLYCLSAVVVVAAVVSVALPAVAADKQSAAQPQVGKTVLSKADSDRRKKAPKDVRRFVGHDNRAVMLYHDRLEFFSLPAGRTVTVKGRFSDGSAEVDPSETMPSKIIWFSRPTTVMTKPQAPNILVCTADWLAKQAPAGLDHFCGIVSAQGEVIYTFPFQQHAPDSILNPLAISDDGKYAEVWIGRLVPGEDGRSPSEPREVLTWRYPNKLTKIPGPWAKGAPKEPAKAFSEFVYEFRTRQTGP